MSRTRIIFFAVIALAVLVVAGSLIWQGISQQNTNGPLLPDVPAKLEVRVVCALPVEPWVQEAARQLRRPSRRSRNLLRTRPEAQARNPIEEYA